MTAVSSLTAEAALDVDTMTDYLSVARGSYIITQAIVVPLSKDPRNRPIYSTAAPVMTMIEDQAKDLDLIADFQKAVKSLRPLCRNEAELQYQKHCGDR